MCHKVPLKVLPTAETKVHHNAYYSNMGLFQCLTGSKQLVSHKSENGLPNRAGKDCLPS